MAGNEDEKLQVLRSLSSTDFRLADRHPIPERFWVTVDGGEKVEYTHTNFIRTLDFRLFEDLAENLVTELPMIPKKVGDEIVGEEFQVPEDVLCLYTALIEKGVGQIMPSI